MVRSYESKREPRGAPGAEETQMPVVDPRIAGKPVPRISKEMMERESVARALHARHIFTERVDGKMTFRRGFSVAKGEIAVVVEDVITTGGSSLEVVELLQEAGATPSAAGSIIDRSGGTQRIDVPFHALATISLPTYQPEQCPLCAEGKPVVKPGSRT